MPFTVQLKQSVEEHLEEILSYGKSFDENNETITDVQSASQFQKCKNKYSKSFLLSLTVNTDGVQIFNSTKKSVWPIQVIQNFLPPTIRYRTKNVIVVALHDGKPNMCDFLYPFLQELKKINEEGGLQISKNGERYTFMPIITSFTADLPAKADVLGMVGHCGYFACSYCTHPGNLIKKDRKTKAVVRFVAKKYPSRTHGDILSTYMKLKSTPINGVKSISCMIAACDFDLIDGFSIDYLHCALLGVTRLLMNLWLNTEYHAKPFYISKRKQTELSKRIVAIKPISEITRKPRSVSERNDYKANEFRTLLLYYLRYSLVDILPLRYINHFQLFSSAIYTLLQEKISFADISNAEDKLNRFSDEFENLYGKEYVTMNLHLIRHMGNSVRNLGPLWAQSAFTFEMNNGIIVKANHATKDFLHNLSWKYVVKSSLQEETENKIDRNITVGGKVNIRISEDELNEFDLEVTSEFLTVYSSVTYSNNKKITSLKSKVASNTDFFVELHTNEIGAVKYFIVKDYNIYAFINMYGVKVSSDHLLEVEPTGISKLFNIKEISKKMVYMRIAKFEIVTCVPNKYEQS